MQWLGSRCDDRSSSPAALCREQQTPRIATGWQGEEQPTWTIVDPHSGLGWMTLALVWCFKASCSRT